MDNQVNHARAGWDVLAALQGGTAVAPEAPPAPAKAEPAVAHARVRKVRADVAAAPAPVDSAPLERIETRPRVAAKRLAGAALLVSVPAAALAGWAAWTARDATLGGVALILGALSAGLWFLRVVTVPTYVSLHGPRLEVRQGSRSYVWDLASAYSPVDHVRGKPGRGNWRVIMRNPDGTTFAIDGSMLPAKQFAAILSRYRPEL